MSRGAYRPSSSSRGLIIVLLCIVGSVGLHGVAYDGYDRSVDAHVKNLRRKLEPDPSEPHYVLTVYGVGYKFTDEV